MNKYKIDISKFINYLKNSNKNIYILKYYFYSNL